MTNALQYHNAPEFAFAPLYPVPEVHRIEKSVREWDVTRRIATCLATQSREELTASLRKINTSDDGGEVIDLLEGVRGLVEFHSRLISLFEAVEARILISAHDAFGIPLSDTEPS